nr:aminotransferase class I/II-fold pyridoxal phosphate-dependent enzyme [Glycomyces xiaoerkulensis]
MREFEFSDLAAHPFGAEEGFIAAYSRHLGVPEEHLVAGRGITEFIWTLSRILPANATAAVTPDYTDIIAAFPNHVAGPAPEEESPSTRLSALASAMSGHRFVILSNPNNPLGTYVPTAELADLCRSRPDSTLIVDESYLVFSPHHDSSLVGFDLPNAVVLQSPTKLFGVAGIRTGVLCTRNRRLLAALEDEKLTWPLSLLDSIIAQAALSEAEWAAQTRERLLRQAEGMQAALEASPLGVLAGAPVHYRFVPADDPSTIHKRLLDLGFVVRAFNGAEPGRVSGLRITTPIEDELAAFARALETI